MWLVDVITGRRRAVAATVVDEPLLDARGQQVGKGLRAFAPGTTVYLCRPAMWPGRGSDFGRVRVVGRVEARDVIIGMVVNARRLRDFRVVSVGRPYARKLGWSWRKHDPERFIQAASQFGAPR